MQLVMAIETEKVTATAQKAVSSQFRPWIKYWKPWRSVRVQNQPRLWRHLIVAKKPFVVRPEQNWILAQLSPNVKSK